MAKIDKRKKYFIVLDTETTPIDSSINEVKPTNMLAYDIGFSVVDRMGIVYKKFSFVIDEIFFGEPTLMRSAYYYNKIPQYLRDIANGDRIVASFNEVRNIIIDTMEEYNINEVYAHNMMFDYWVLNKTNKWITGNWEFFPIGTECKCTLKMARETVCKETPYIIFCNDNGYMTKHETPRVRATAEIVYRYITDDNDFIESHTGLEDVLIEKEIFAYCRPKALRKKVNDIYRIVE